MCRDGIVRVCIGPPQVNEIPNIEHSMNAETVVKLRDWRSLEIVITRALAVVIRRVPKKGLSATCVRSGAQILPHTEHKLPALP